jgi:hypothetical protein
LNYSLDLGESIIFCNALNDTPCYNGTALTGLSYGSHVITASCYNGTTINNTIDQYFTIQTTTTSTTTSTTSTTTTTEPITTTTTTTLPECSGTEILDCSSIDNETTCPDYYSTDEYYSQCEWYIGNGDPAGCYIGIDECVTTTTTTLAVPVDHSSSSYVVGIFVLLLLLATSIKIYSIKNKRSIWNK